MSIFFDARMASHPGIGRYIREIACALMGISESQKLSFILSRGEKVCEPFNHAQSLFASSKIYSWQEQVEIPKITASASLLHVPHFNIPVFYPGKLVATIHDLIYLKDSKASKYPMGKIYAKLLIGRAVRKALAIITVSEYTKKDILAYFPKTNPDKIKVIYEAASPVFKTTPQESEVENFLEQHRLKKNFILFVGSLKKHKNIHTLLKSLESLRSRGIDSELVLIGRRDPKENGLWKEIENAGPQARYLGELPDRELLCAYHACGVFVLPSFWEGFGLPALEAMSCGAPVILSSRASLPEVGGDAALYFNPEEADALAAHLLRVLSDETLRKKLSEKSLKQAALFSWERAGRETLQVYREVLG